MPGQFSQACGKKIYETVNGRQKFVGFCNKPKQHGGKCSMK